MEFVAWRIHGQCVERLTSRGYSPGISHACNGVKKQELSSIIGFFDSGPCHLDRQKKRLTWVKSLW
jgi:hypothetical protein